MRRNLLVSKKIGVFLIVLAGLLVGVGNVSGADRFAVASGNWTSAIWASTQYGSAGSATIPTLNDNVFIAPGVSVNIDANSAVLSIQILNSSDNNNTTLSINSGMTIIVGTGTGKVTIGSANGMGNGNKNTTTLIVYGNLICGTIDQQPGSRTNGQGGAGSTVLAINSSGTVSSSGDISGTSVLGGNQGTATASVIFNGSGSLNLKGSFTTSTFIPSTGTVNYNGSSQSVRGEDYHNLILSGSGYKTIIAGTAVTGNLSIAPTGSAKASIVTGLSISVGSLTLGGLGTAAGVASWGSTSSVATYRNNTYFDATNGTVGVTTDTRTTPTVTPTVGTYTYNGSAQGPNSATNTGTGTSYTFSYSGMGGTTYEASATRPTNAGTYIVKATVAASTDGFYKPASSSAAAFTIDKAAPTISVSGTQVFTYNGSSQGSATITYNGDGTTSLLYTNTSGTAYSSSTAPTNAGSYKVVASTTEGTNYLAASSADYTFTIDKATPTISVSGTQAFTYNGSSQGPATIAYNGDGTTSLLYTNTSGTPYSSSTAPANAGSYKVVASSTAGINYLAASSADYTFTINKATPTATLAVNNSTLTYDGTAKAATVGITTSSVPGSVSNILTGGAASQISANTYAVTADFVPTDAVNYNSLTGLSVGNFVIDKATPTLSVTNSPVTYDGTAKSANVLSSVAGTISNILTGGAANQTNVGTYAVTADFVPTDATNYRSLTAASAGNFVIDKATPTLSVTNSPLTYNGSAQSATVIGTGGGTVSNIKYDGSYSVPTNAGTYAVTADIAASMNYSSATNLLAGNFIIKKASLTITANNRPKCFGETINFAGTEFTSSGLVGPDAVTSVTLYSDGAASSATPGNYPITPSVAAGSGLNNYTISYNNGTLTVNALPTITLSTSPSVCKGTTAANLPYSATSGSPNQYSIIYDATAHTAGFSDVSLTSLPATPIGLLVPANASVGTYNGTITVKNANGCLSTGTPFTVTIQDIDVSVTDQSDNKPESCPDFYDFNGNTVGYKAGYSILKFRVTRSLSNAEWNFDYMLSGGNLYTGSPASSSGSRSVPNGSNAVDLEFHIANTPGSAQTIQFKVTNISDSNCTHNGINKTVSHTISAMPVIGSFN